MPEPVDFRGRAASDDTRKAVVVALAVVGVVAVGILKPWDAVPRSPQSTAAAELDSSPAADVVAPPAGTTPVPSGDVQLLPFGLLPPPRGPEWSALHWEALPADHPVAILRFVVRGPAGFVAVGSGEARTTPVWSSADGSSWNPVPYGMPDTFWRGSVIVGAAASASSVVLIAGLRTAASCPPDVACPPFLSGLDAWASDDGRSWTPRHVDGLARPADPLAVHVAGIASTVVVMGPPEPSPGGPGTRVALSVDGRVWRLLPADALPTGFSVTDLATLHGRFIAAGRLEGGPGAQRAAIASSADGAAWTVSPLPAPPLAALDVEAATPLRIAAGPDGALVMGSGAGQAGLESWWRSSDGVTWSPVAGFPPVGPRSCPPDESGCALAADGIVVGDGTRLVAGGFIDDGPGVDIWVSSDGAAWRRLAAPAGGPSGRLDGLSALPGGVVAWADGAPWYGTAATTSP